MSGGGTRIASLTFVASRNLDANREGKELPVLSNLKVPRKEDLEYLAALRDERLEAARKADRKSFDAYVKAQYERLFPAK